MTWYDHADRTKPVIDPRTQIASKYPDMEIPELPPRAVVFCLGKGLPVLKEHFPCHPIMEKLPGFITHSEVLGIEGVSGLCFLHKNLPWQVLVYLFLRNTRRFSAENANRAGRFARPALSFCLIASVIQPLPGLPGSGA